MDIKKIGVLILIALLLILFGYFVGYNAKKVINVSSNNLTNQSFEGISNKSLMQKIVDYISIGNDNKPVCGNGKCESGEDARCAGGEGCYSCPKDCSQQTNNLDCNTCLSEGNNYLCTFTQDNTKICSSSMQGNANCVLCNQTPQSPICGNGICEQREVNYRTFSQSLIYCPQDCPENVKSSPVCGNGKCEKELNETALPGVYIEGLRDNSYYKGYYVCAKDCGILD